jgi:hypothetical protein
MTTEKTIGLIQVCFENICKNYNISAGLNISEPLQDRSWDGLFHVFIDINTASHVSFYEKEIWMNLLKTGVKSKRDYRKLRSLVRTRLINAIHGIRNLTEESLRNLGAKI